MEFFVRRFRPRLQIPRPQGCRRPGRSLGRHFFFGILFELLDSAAHLIKILGAQRLAGQFHQAAGALFILNVGLNCLRQRKHVVLECLVVDFEVEQLRARVPRRVRAR